MHELEQQTAYLTVNASQKVRAKTERLLVNKHTHFLTTS
jgi:hypothetical protein